MGFLTTMITGGIIGALLKWQYDENWGSMAEMRLKLSNAGARISHLQNQQKEAVASQQELSEAKSMPQEVENQGQEAKE